MHSASFPWFFLIPVVAVVGGLAVGAIAILTEHRRKLALLEERRLMIEKGMTPPPLGGALLEHGAQAGTRYLVESSLRTGVITLFVGLGLIGAFLVLRYLVFADSFIPSRVISLLGPAGVLVALIGVGHLVYFRIARGRVRDGDA
ncbi:MAG TPA: DUF6249 domain-containing protein [Steroidobacteraceae bacterium]|nr:DUF6249 domain-containing protein [Steroidobacteraceae bacterium]